MYECSYSYTYMYANSYFRCAYNLPRRCLNLSSYHSQGISSPILLNGVGETKSTCSLAGQDKYIFFVKKRQAYVLKSKIKLNF